MYSMYEIIEKKKLGNNLKKEEIDFVVSGYSSGEIPDYQMSALLMGIYFQGMDAEETYNLTSSVVNSGEVLDLSKIEGVKADKHSTGGVGDKTSLIVLPMAATENVKIPKMSGRGLGHTGGTVDKLESIPGFTTDISSEDFIKITEKVGFAIAGQTKNLAPADKKIYALRDVTATVDSIPLIVSSIMGKKLASGTDVIVLDVKMGSGAFMKDIESARELSKAMVEIGKRDGKKVAAIITNMDIPLGSMVGNSLEVMEVIKTLNGNGPKDLEEISVNLAANMVSLAKNTDFDENLKKMRESLYNGSAYEKFKEFLIFQGADKNFVENDLPFENAKYSLEVKAQKSGFISHMDTEHIGLTSSHLGAGRLKKEDEIDYLAGIEILKKTGNELKEGEVIARLFTSDEKSLKEAEKSYQNSVEISDKKPEQPVLIYERII